MTLYLFFSALLDRSISVLPVIGIVLLLRLVLRRADRIWSFVLWLAVLFRLLCPVTLSLPVGLAGQTAFQQEVQAFSGAQVSLAEAASAVGNAFGGGKVQSVTVPLSSGAASVSVGWRGALVPMGSYVWLAGAVLLLLWSGISLLCLRRRLTGAVRLEGNLRQADGIPTPFVMGLIRPRIYLPSGLTGEERAYIVAHERHHIRRGDPLWQALAYLALCLYWFHPLVWLAFFLARRDMELSCDEAVLRASAGDIRADYAGSLLRFASGRLPASAALTFGECDTKERVAHALRYKRPARWITVVAAVLCLCAVAVLISVRTGAQHPVWLPQGQEDATLSSASFTVQDGVIASASYKLRSQDGRLLEYRYTPQDGVILQGESSPTNLDRATKTTGADLDAALQAVIRKVRSEQPDAKELAVGFTAADFYFSGKDFFRGWVYSLSKNEFRSFASGGVYDGSREYGMLAVNADNQGTVLFCLDK